MTSIFSFFFGGYFKEREWAYRLWIRFMAYDADFGTEDEQKAICAELESKERVYRQAKILLILLLCTLLIEFVVFQFYSLKYITVGSPYHEPDAFNTYIYFNIIIGFIVLINAIELIFISVAMKRTSQFPYFKFRKRVTGQDRLSMLWCALHCNDKKKKDFRDARIPEIFYDDLEK